MSSLISLGLTFFTAAGLGIWIPLPSIGGQLFVGAALIPILLYLLNFVAHLSLTTSAMIIMALAVPGIIQIARLIGKNHFPPREILNPAIVLPFAFAAIIAFRGFEHYSPFAWDEFASWLYWTKEAYLTDTFLAPDMLWRSLAYPQGWPMAMLFPQLLFERFDLSRSVPIGLLWHAAVLGIIFDILASYCARVSKLPLTSCWAIAWLVILGLLSVEATWTLLPQVLGVEKSQLFIVAEVFGLLLLGLIHPKNSNGIAFAVGIILSAGFLVKAPTLAVVPAAVLIVLLPMFRQEDQGHGSTANWWALLRHLALLLIPLAGVYLSWKGIVQPPEGCLTDPTKLDLKTGGGDPIAHAFSVADKILQAALDYISVYKFPLTVISLAGFLIGFMYAPFAVIAVGVILYIVIYIVGLVPLFAFCYGDYEVSTMQSLQRYVRVPPLRLLHLFGVVFFVLGSLKLLSRFWPSAVNLFAGRIGIAVLLAGSIAGGVYQAHKIKASIHNVETRLYNPASGVAFIDKVTKEAAALNRQIDRRKLDAPKVILIAQNSEGFEHRIAFYYALRDKRGDKRGEKRLRYKLFRSISWGESKANIWMNKTTGQKLQAVFSDVRILWPMRLDPWVTEILKGLTDVSTCQQDLTNYFLIKEKRSDKKFQCVLKYN